MIISEKALLRKLLINSQQYRVLNCNRSCSLSVDVLVPLPSTHLNDRCFSKVISIIVSRDCDWRCCLCNSWFKFDHSFNDHINFIINITLAIDGISCFELVNAWDTRFFVYEFSLDVCVEWFEEPKFLDDLKKLLVLNQWASFRLRLAEFIEDHAGQEIAVNRCDLLISFSFKFFFSV